MAESYKVLGQLSPLAATLTDLYTVPSARSSVISTIVAANRSAVATSIRIAIAIGGIADSVEQYIAYDLAIAGNTSITFTIGISLATTDVIRVYATLATVNFNVFGVEIS